MENQKDKLIEGEFTREIKITQHGSTGTRIEIKTYNDKSEVMQIISLSSDNLLDCSDAKAETILLSKQLQEEFNLNKK